MIKFLMRTFLSLILLPWRLFKLLAGYCFLLAIATVLYSMMSETANFTKKVSSANEAQRSYMGCVFIMRTLEPHATDFASCNPYKMDRSLASENSIYDPINAECAPGKRLTSYFGKPVCTE